MLYDASDKVVGIATKDMGISKDGSKKETFQPGVDIKGLSLSLITNRKCLVLIRYVIFSIHRESYTIC